MTIIRGAGAGDAVVTILRAAAQDPRLSFRARGVLVAVMSRPHDWRTNYRQLAGEAREGERAVLGALSELEACGYLSRERIRCTAHGTCPGGRHIATSWVISDRPGRRFLQPTKVQPTKQRSTRVQRTKQQPAEQQPAQQQPAAQQPAKVQRVNVKPGAVQGLETRETEGETPQPPPPPPLALVVDGLVVVVVDGIGGRAPAARRDVLRRECRRLADEGWTAEQLGTVVGANDWSGAGAGAVVSFLRGLTPADKPSRQARGGGKGRPEWCGVCEEVTRLVEDPSTGRQRRCPDCHPLAGKVGR